MGILRIQKKRETEIAGDMGKEKWDVWEDEKEDDDRRIWATSNIYQAFRNSTSLNIISY
jgi:hypothetical protein